METSRRILIAEDEPEIALTFQRLLGPRHTYDVVGSIAGLRATLRADKSYAPDLFVADLLLEDGDLMSAVFEEPDLEPCLRWPTLIVSVKSCEDALERCLVRWAADYVTKPFPHAEFTVKARRVLEGERPGPRPFQFSPISMRVSRDGAESETLTAHEARLFNALAKRPGLAASADALMAEVWEESRFNKKLVVTAARLRKKLAPLGLALTTDDGTRGYKLEVG